VNVALVAFGVPTIAWLPFLAQANNLLARGNKTTISLAVTIRSVKGALRRAVLDSANRLYRAYGAVADAIDGGGARPRRALCDLSTQAVV
jgi:hypothetical protein